MFTVKYDFAKRAINYSCAPVLDNEICTLFLDGHVDDEETLGKRYAESGFETMVKDMNGCFAIAVFDKITQELFVARDRLGAKQVYYSKNFSEICVSTEFKVCMDYNGHEISEVALQHFFSFQYVPEPLTIIENVYALKLGHFSIINGDSYTEKRFNIWKPAPVEGKDREYFKKEIKAALEDAVKKNLEGHKKVAAFLSGGLDSSILTAIAAKDHPDMTSYTIAFDVPGFSEAEVAANSASFYGIKHEIVKVTSKDFVDASADAVKAMGVPVADPSAIAVSLIAKAAEGKCDVIMSGEGSDELWGGYHVYNPRGTVLKVKAMPEPVKKSLWFVAKNWKEDHKGKDMLRRGCVPLRDRFVGNTFLFTDAEKKQFLKTYNKNVHFTDITASYFDEAEQDGLSEMDQMQFIDTNIWLPGDIDVVCGKGCSARNLNCVTPFMDNTVTDLARTLTRDEKIAGVQNKIVLREAFSGMITDEVRDGKKKGYPVPVRVWLSGELNSWAKEYVAATDINRYIDKEYAYGLLDKCRENPDNPMYYRKAWAILVFCIWYREVFQK